jgi:uncharacterized protein YndB with AHSA1/START domain
MSGFGAPRSDGDGRLALRYERHYEATPEEVWSAFTEPESIRRWLFADATLEPRVGGELRLDWTEGRVEGSVLVWEPPRLLEIEWLEPDLQSIVSVEISASEKGALLVLEHRSLTVEPALRVGPGWHAHLDVLGELLAGRAGTVDEWREHFESLRPSYEELTGGF